MPALEESCSWSHSLGNMNIYAVNPSDTIIIKKKPKHTAWWLIYKISGQVLSPTRSIHIARDQPSTYHSLLSMEQYGNERYK